MLAQVVDVFHLADGADNALREVETRSGSWFDPNLAKALAAVSARGDFWEALRSANLQERIFELEPARCAEPMDEEYLDEIVAAFAQVVDAKSHYTAGHSERVALFADMIAEAMDMSRDRRRWLKRAALLHDIGKLGVSNSILDKPGKLDADEWSAMKMHAVHGEVILSQVSAFESFAFVAAAHHERLDGKGYPRGLAGDQIPFETRIITAADVFDALTADRPYRAALPIPAALSIMQKDVGAAIDPRCFVALDRAIAKAREMAG